MVKKNIGPNIILKIADFLGHPAWNGVSCFMTALATFVALGFGGYLLAFVFGFVSGLQDLVIWLSEPLNISRYVIIGGLIVLTAFMATTVQQYLSSRGKFSILRKRGRANENRAVFLPIPLRPGIGNTYLKDRYINPPTGDVVLNGVRFLLEPDMLIFDTSKPISSYTPRNDGGKEVDFRLPEPASGVKSVHLLINSGNSKNVYANESIGKIRLIFRDAPPIVVEIVLGQNIREWCPGNTGEFVRETSGSSTTNVWTGMSKNGANAVIDRLTIPVFECMKSCPLEQIVFVHKPIQKPPDTMGVHFSVFAISLEIERQM